MPETTNTNLLAVIKKGTDNNKLIKWPGTDTPVILKILSEQERLDASLATERLFKSEKVEANLMTADQYESEKTIQMLYRALRCPDNLDTPLCPNISQFRKALSREDMKMLITEYLGYESLCSPSPENLSSEDFDRLLQDLKKNATATTTNITSLCTARKLLLILAAPPQVLPPVNG
ncbi:MAG: hypothetical protein ABSA76_14330 [Bacteroidales bacterium]